MAKSKGAKSKVESFVSPFTPPAAKLHTVTLSLTKVQCMVLVSALTEDKRSSLQSELSQGIAEFIERTILDK